MPENETSRPRSSCPRQRPGDATGTRPVPTSATAHGARSAHRRLPRWTPAAALAAIVAAPGAEACAARTPTPEAPLGPHDFASAPASNELWRDGDPGEPLVLSLRVLDTCGRPIAGARVHLLHADGRGTHVPGRYRAILESDARGEVQVLTVLPGYAGDLARHIHFIISHPGHAELVTRLYFKNDPSLAGRERDPLALVPEEVRRGETTRWVSGYEFVLRPAGS